ncbi:helix-turn-helix transcriptional regulator [Alicycliphilus denitrificans]|uniref:ATP-dependent transcriptional regulator, MalT-like, LuxR family n=1 Tax=Alicycliphilus denitrificans (strain DSM 14773 / CIP 107495 / K601) TaxID=596154 RepID=F4GFV6_ALIDK|nr:ATP-dependent transcriptional regulator, MalT-like, LuxR family [Alicycliphilus denitrificans K601]
MKGGIRCDSLGLQLMTLLNIDSATTYSELVLKTMPPRAPRHQLVRSRLSLADEQFRERSVIVVQAPPGFGKTSLLGQWRREYLARGAAVAWVTADAGDDLQRFLHCLVMAVRSGCVRPAFGRLLLETQGTKPGEFEGITAWLAEVAQTSLDMVLVVDEAERLAPGNFAALSYLMHNTPPNLHVVVGARGGVDATIADLVDYGQALSLGADDLRFRLDETMALVRERCGEKIDADSAARLHEQTEGWPLGLQIMLAAVEKGGDLHVAMTSMAGKNGGNGEGFVGGLLANLAAKDVDFLVRISCVDLVHPDLCRALTGLETARDILVRLVRETPVFVVSDGSEWGRLHNLVRDALRGRLVNLPADERLELHRRAMHWLAEHGMIHEAARHAHEAGQHEIAYDLAEQCLYEAVTQGHQESVLRWLDLLPEAQLLERPRLRLAAAWALALSERHAEAESLVRDILEDQDADPSLRYECALIASGAAYYADQPDRCLALFQPWMGAPPPGQDPRLLQMHANRQAAMAILAGDPARARRYLQTVPHGDFGKRYSYGVRWGSFITGLSYLWEGQGVLGEEMLQPALGSADAELGRRAPFSCMTAALLAAAVYERDRIDEAAELLANRLDVLERVGIPETVLLGYRTAARIAAAKGVEHRALDLLEVLYAVGVARNLPRLCVASLGEQIRMHAGRFRSETCRALVQRIDDIVAGHDVSEGPIWRASLEVPRRLAHANTLIAAQDWSAAAEALANALPLVESAKLGRSRIEIMALRALALERAGRNGKPLLLEAMNLALTFSLSRTFVDAHPALADWVRRTAEEDGAGHRIQIARTARPLPERAAGAPRAVPSMVLTPKEREVLEHLARNLSNKEIAQAMEVGEETVKWHLKNLFGKLDAGTRKHVVRRAQLLGLLVGLE